MKVLNDANFIRLSRTNANPWVRKMVTDALEEGRIYDLRYYISSDFRREL